MKRRLLPLRTRGVPDGRRARVDGVLPAVARLSGWVCLWALSPALLPINAAAQQAPAGQHCNTQERDLSAPTARFRDHADGTVTDTQTGLMWMHCAVGQTWSGNRCGGMATALPLAAARVAAEPFNRSGEFFFDDWRLPRLPELASLAERACTNPRINVQVFPDTPAAGFWSSTLRVGARPGTLAYALSYGPDGVSIAGVLEPHYVRLVRTAP